jgi:hypothetical protein
MLAKGCDMQNDLFSLETNVAMPWISFACRINKCIDVNGCLRKAAFCTLTSPISQHHLQLKEQRCVEPWECGGECGSVKTRNFVCGSFLISKIWRLASESLKPNDTQKIDGRTHCLYILFED